MTRERIEALPDSDWRKRKGEEFREPKLSRNLAWRVASDRGEADGGLAGRSGGSLDLKLPRLLEPS
jgi:hypothetical protein